MVCIYCHSDTRVVNSRHQKRLNAVWRRRQCSACNTVFTSLEKVDLSGSIVVRKKTAIEPFSRDTLLLSIHDSLRHRKTALTDAIALTDTIVSQVLAQQSGADVDVQVIVQISQVVLWRFDKVAATHYAAFHPS